MALNLRQKVKLITDVTVHIDPEDDEKVNPSMHLSPREVLEDEIHRACGSYKGFDSLKQLTIHYLNGEIFLDFFFQAKKIDAKSIKSTVMDFKDVAEVNIFQDITP